MPVLALGCLGVPYIWIRPAYVRPENVPEAKVRASLFHNRSLDTDRPAKVPAVARGGRGWRLYSRQWGRATLVMTVPAASSPKLWASKIFNSVSCSPLNAFGSMVCTDPVIRLHKPQHGDWH